MTRLASILLSLALLGGCNSTDEARRERPVTAPPNSQATGAAAARQPVYQCPMHPQIIRNEPGTCPICSMALQRVDDLDPTGSTVQGHASLVLTPERQQLIGVTHAPVEVRSLTRDIRAAATVANDTALYEALIGYREAVRTRGAIRATTLHEAASGGDALVRAAALRLRRMGIGERELVAFSDLDPTTLILPGPHVWIYAQLFEEDAPLVTAGMPLTVEVASQPGRSYASTVFSIDPTVMPDTRTVRVRALVATPDASLRPGTYVTATFHVDLGERLAVPRDAILDSGTHRLVFVAAEGGRFIPREVQLGRAGNGYVEILDGVAAGEHVVTSANFLIDSESRLKAAVAAFGAEPPHAHH
jgi:Cu(I)/Ag(I) efflux system membrane fusion protein